MNTFYDAGVLNKADRGERPTLARHRALLEIGILPVATAPVVAQASRDHKQVGLRRLLRGCSVVGFDRSAAHHVGSMLALSETSDVIDAHLVWLASQAAAAAVLTTDVGDLSALAAVADGSVRVIAA